MVGFSNLDEWDDRLSKEIGKVKDVFWEREREIKKLIFKELIEVTRLWNSFQIGKNRVGKLRSRRIWVSSERFTHTCYKGPEGWFLTIPGRILVSIKKERWIRIASIRLKQNSKYLWNHLMPLGVFRLLTLLAGFTFVLHNHLIPLECF